MPTEIDFSKIPPHMIDPVKLYLSTGYVDRGDFLYAVLINSLTDAVYKADDINRDRIRDWVEFVYWELPGNAWGSPEIVDAWVEAKASDQRAEMEVDDERA